MVGGGVSIVVAREVQCSNCSKLIKVRIYSAGFGDEIPFTCDRDSTVLTISIYNKKLRSILGSYPKSGWTESQARMVEAELKPCFCGGTFKHDAQPKCPNCGAILGVDGLGSSEFVVVGRMVDGEKENPWRQ